MAPKLSRVPGFSSLCSHDSSVWTSVCPATLCLSGSRLPTGHIPRPGLLLPKTKKLILVEPPTSLAMPFTQGGHAKACHHFYLRVLCEVSNRYSQWVFAPSYVLPRYHVPPTPPCFRATERLQGCGSFGEDPREEGQSRWAKLTLSVLLHNSAPNYKTTLPGVQAPCGKQTSANSGK